MAGITTLEGSGFIPEIWLSAALGYLRNYITILPTVTTNTDLGGGAFEVGRTLHLPKRGLLNVNQKTETGNYVVQNPQSSTVDLSLVHHPEVTVSLTSELLAMQNQPEQVGYIQDGAAKIAEDVEASLFGLWRTVSAANTITNAGTITEQNILSANQILRNNKIAFGTEKYGVVSTAEEAAILQLPNLVRYDATGKSGNTAEGRIGEGGKMRGSIGAAYGFEISPTQLVPQVSASDNSVQTLTISGAPGGGTFQPTAGANPVSYNATPAQVQAALYPVFGAGNVYVAGTAGVSYQVAIPSASAALAPVGNFTGGTSPSIAAAQVSQANGARNLFYTRDAILFASRPLPLPSAGSGAIGTVMTDEVTGLTMRLVTSWNPNQGAMQMTIDMLYGVAPLRGEHLCLINSVS